MAKDVIMAGVALGIPALYFLGRIHGATSDLRKEFDAHIVDARQAKQDYMPRSECSLQHDAVDHNLKSLIEQHKATRKDIHDLRESFHQNITNMELLMRDVRLIAKGMEEK